MSHPSTASPETDQSITTAIVTTIADCEEVAPTDLPPLYDRINTDALDKLIAHRNAERASGETQVSFHYYGYEVTVTDDRRVHVRDTAQ